MESFTKLRYWWAHVLFRNKPVIKKVRYGEDVVEEVLRLCPKPFRMMCYMGAKELNLNLSLIAEMGRDVPTAVALAFEDVTLADYHMPRFWRYIKTGDPGPHAGDILKKWGAAFRRRKV